MSLDNSGKASEKQNNIIKAWFYTDIFSSTEPLTAALNRSDERRVPTLGNTYGLFFLQQREGEQNSLALATCLVLAPWSSLCLLFCVYHPSGSQEGGSEKGCDTPRCVPTCRAASLTLGYPAWGQPSEWVEVMELKIKTFIKNLARQPLPAPKFLPK